jgi:hypothetical protein
MIVLLLDTDFARLTTRLRGASGPEGCFEPGIGPDSVVGSTIGVHNRYWEHQSRAYRSLWSRRCNYLQTRDIATDTGLEGTPLGSG